MPENSSPRFMLKQVLLAIDAVASASAIAQEGSTIEKKMISTKGYEQELKQAPTSISVVTREELETKNFRYLS